MSRSIVSSRCLEQQASLNIPTSPGLSDHGALRSGGGRAGGREQAATNHRVSLLLPKANSFFLMEMSDSPTEKW